jgi:ribosome-associated translation inhibitor RaiA
MKHVSWLAVAGLAALVSGCSSPPTAKDVARDETAAAEVRARAEADRLAREEKAAERYMGSVPAWALVPPRADAEGFYAVGISESSKLDTALKKAMLTAEYGLAKNYKAVISGNERQYQRDAGRGAVSERYTLLIDQVVDRVPLAGYEVAKREVRTIDGTFHTFVLLKLSYDELNKALANAKKAEADASIDEQFAELERRLDKYKAARAAEAAQGKLVARAADAGEQGRRMPGPSAATAEDREAATSGAALPSGKN